MRTTTRTTRRASHAQTTTTPLRQRDACCRGQRGPRGRVLQAQGMIDSHCHLVHGLDDGPRTMAEALRMARRLVEFGVRAVVCTPHFSRRFPTSVSDASASYQALRRTLDTLGVELETHLAAEIGPDLALIVPAAELTRRSLPSGFAIIELVSSTPPEFIVAATQRLAELGLRPVFAHPERCLAVQKKPGILDEARAAGALVQVVAPSLLTQSHRGIAAAAWGLIDSGRADLLASDAHRPYGNRIQLGLIGDLVSQRYGGPVLEALTVGNPARLLRAPQ